MNEILGRSSWAPIVFGCQAPDTGNAEIIAHYGTPEQKERYLQPLLNGECFSCYSMTEPQGGSDPTLFTTQAPCKDGDEWVHQRLEVLLLQRPHGLVPHRHGGDQPRREPVQGHVDVPRADGHARREHRAQRRPVRASRSNEGSHALIHYEDVRVPADACSGGEGQAFAIAQTRLGGGRIHHAMRTIGMAQKALDMMCERALSRETQGSLLADKQFVQGYIADSYAQLHPVPAVRAVHGVGDRQVQRLQAGAQGHRHGQGRHAQRAARHRLAGHAGPRRARRDQRDAVLRHDARRRRHGPGRRADRGAQGHRRPPGAARLQGRATTCGPRSGCPRRRTPRRRSSPSTSSSRWGTCERPPKRRRHPTIADVDDADRLAGRPGPGRTARRSSTATSRAAARTRSTSSAEATCTAPCASRRPPRRPRGRGHPPRVAHHRGPRRHRRAPHRGHRRLHRPVGARPHLLPDGVRRRLVAHADPARQWPRPLRHRSRGAARASPSSWSRASPCCRKVDWQAKGLEDLGRPDGFHERQVDRWTAFLERIKGRELPGFDEAAAWLRAHRPIDYIPGLMHGDYQFANVMFQHGAPARLAAIVDWEMGTVGDPKLDLGWVVQSWPEDTTADEDRAGGYVDMTGMPSRTECSAHYAEVSGRQVDDIDYYCVLAKWKLAVVLEQGFQRAGRRREAAGVRADRARPDAGGGRAGRDAPTTPCAARARLTGARRALPHLRRPRGRGAGGGPRTADSARARCGCGSPSAAVNFPDVLVVANTYQVKVPTPFVPGSEFAGVVIEVGDDVTASRSGDRVFGSTFVGAFAEESWSPGVLADADPRRRRRPRRRPPSAWPTAPRTTCCARWPRSQPGEELVVLGAGGGVGSAAVQLGVALGATVTAVASSPEKLEAAAACGAHPAASTTGRRPAPGPARRAARRRRRRRRPGRAATWPSRPCARCASAAAS